MPISCHYWYCKALLSWVCQLNICKLGIFLFFLFFQSVARITQNSRRFVTMWAIERSKAAFLGHPVVVTNVKQSGCLDTIRFNHSAPELSMRLIFYYVYCKQNTVLPRIEAGPPVHAEGSKFQPVCTNRRRWLLFEDIWYVIRFTTDDDKYFN